MNPIPCKTCNNGTLVPRKIYRMSTAVVMIGWIFLLPSLLGIGFSLLMLFSTPGAAAGAMQSAKKEAEEALRDAGVPAAIVEKVVDSKVLTAAESSGLTQSQRDVVLRVQARLAGAAVGTGAGGLLTGGASICIGISSFCGGLLGWLLVMKKKVLQCVTCSAVVAAS